MFKSDDYMQIEGMSIDFVITAVLEQKTSPSFSGLLSCGLFFL